MREEQEKKRGRNFIQYYSEIVKNHVAYQSITIVKKTLRGSFRRLQKTFRQKYSSQ